MAIARFILMSAFFTIISAISAIETKEQKTEPYAILNGGRTVFQRMESNAALNVMIINPASDLLSEIEVSAYLDGISVGNSNPAAEIQPQGEMSVELPLDTTLKARKYSLTLSLKGRMRNKPAHLLTTIEKDIAIMPRPLPHAFPVANWGIMRLEDLTDIGFTHSESRTLRPDCGRVWEREGPLTANRPEKVLRGVAELDHYLANGLRCFVRLDPGRHIMRSKSLGDRYQRVDQNGKPYRRSNVCGQFPEVQHFCQDVGTAFASSYGGHPALWAVDINTEVRDGTNICYHEHDLDAYRRATGLNYPMEYIDLSREQLNGAIPPNGVVADDHPLLVFKRWFWKTGDGWNTLHETTHKGLKSVEGGGNIITFFDPAARAPALWGSGGGLDAISHWSYTYPDPPRIALATDEMLAMTDGNPGQKTFKMTQVIWYRDRVAPRNDKTSQPQADWEIKEPDAGFITCAPDHLREALWLKISRPIDGILYYGPGCLVGGGQAQRMTNPNTRKTLKELIQRVIVPLGPTLMQLPDGPREVAMLESFTSMVFGAQPTWGWARGWGGEVHKILQWARLQPKVVYEETILRDDLKGVDVLVAPDCHALTVSVVDKIKAFQQRGGLVVADENLVPAITPDLIINRKHRSTHSAPDKFKAYLQDQGQLLRDELAAVYTPPADSSNPDVLVRGRVYKDTDYLFAINDKRTFGDYVGHHRKVMEKGLPNQAELYIKRKNVHVYDLLANREAASATINGGTTWPVSLDPGSGQLFMITPKPVSAVAIDITPRTLNDRNVKITVSVVDARNQPLSAIIPVEIRISDPNGEETEFSGHYGAKDGIQTVALRLAANDQTGTWKVTARELATDRVAEDNFIYHQ